MERAVSSAWRPRFQVFTVLVVTMAVNVAFSKATVARFLPPYDLNDNFDRPLCTNHMYLSTFYIFYYKKYSLLYKNKLLISIQKIFNNTCDKRNWTVEWQISYFKYYNSTFLRTEGLSFEEQLMTITFSAVYSEPIKYTLAHSILLLKIHISLKENFLNIDIKKKKIKNTSNERIERSDEKYCRSSTI